MSEDEVRDLILRHRLVAILRAGSEHGLDDALDALAAGGIRAAEVTFTTPGAERILRRATDRLKDRMLLGAGTVLSAADVRRAADAGARFVVAPTLDPSVIESARGLGLVAIPGAFSPTEILAGWRAGAHVVKVFPADTLGPGFFRALRGPLPDIPLMATGGIDAGNGSAYLAAGAAVLGVGGRLVDPALVAAGRWDEITERARALVRLAEG